MAPSDSHSILTRVRDSCARLLSHEDAAVHVDPSRIADFVRDLDWQEFATLSEPQRFPLNFRSLEDEINFLTLLGLMSFGSGYRKELHKYCDRGASETILFGLIGMYISVPKLDAAYLSGLSIDVLANYFSLPLDRDEELSPGIYVSKPGPLKPLAEMIYKTVTESARKLKEQNYGDFGAFVLASLRKDEDSKPSAAHLVSQLVTTFPGFADSRVIRGEECFFYKRAQLVATSLYRRFRESEEMFAFDDIDEVTALSDNVLPCVLRALGILEYSPDLAAHIDRGEDLPAGTWECELRAGAIVACDQIVAAVDRKMDVLQLDSYLWRVGKDSRFRGLERHATRDTFFY